MNLNLDTILLGGQAFNWEYSNNRYYGFTHNGLITIDRKGSVQQINEDIDMNRYLGKDLDLKQIKQEINKDKYLNQAITKVKDITILRQDFYITTASYILATNKNIPAIRKSIKTLSNMLGNPIVDTNYKTFPTIESLAQTSVKDLQKASIGYRAPYLKETSRLLSGIKLPNNKEDIKRLLISFPGIGPKVADCILLYSLGYLDTVPIDRWMFNIAKNVYNVKFTKNSDISKWYSEYFGQYAGVAGQYLFEYYRSL